MEKAVKNSHRASISNLPHDGNEGSFVDDGSSFDTSEQSSRQRMAQQRDDLSSNTESTSTPTTGEKKTMKKGSYLKKMFGTSEKTKVSSSVHKAPSIKPEIAKSFLTDSNTDVTHTSLTQTIDKGQYMSPSTEISGASVGDSSEGASGKSCDDISISSVHRDEVIERPSHEGNNHDFLTSNISREGQATSTPKVPSSVTSESSILSSSSSISAVLSPQVPSSVTLGKFILSSSSSVSATSSNEDLADETNADEMGANSERRQSLDQNTSTNPESPSHQAVNRLKNGPSSSLFLSGHHSPAKHVPKYSEFEMRAQIDAAILNTEKEWIDKMKSCSFGHDAQNNMERRMKEQVSLLKHSYEAELKAISEGRDHLLEVQKKEFLEKVAQQEANPPESKGSDPTDVERFELLRKIVSLESQLKAEVASHEKRVATVRDEHAAEIEELLAQLDLVEAEHKERMDELQHSVNQKDVIVSALGEQLADATSKRAGLEQTLTRYTNELDATRKQTTQIQMLSKSQEETIERMKTSYDKALEEERSKRRLACEKVKKEMIAAAEDQFAKANEHYKKLKTEYEAVKENLAAAEKETAKTKCEAEAALKARKSREVEITADIAQLKAALAASEANGARTFQKYSAEIEEMRVAENLLKEKLDEAIDNCTAAHRSLANIVAEKERISRENAEMNAVCEELMAMVEGATTNQTLQRGM